MSANIESAPFFDAHCHYQNAPDMRGAADVGAARSLMEKRGLRACVVNGTNVENWQRVALFARNGNGWAVPAFGVHPWQAFHSAMLAEPFWMEKLRAFLLEFPEAPVGEVGLDFSKKRLLPASPLPMPNTLSAEPGCGETAARRDAKEKQKDTLARQLRLAREINRVVVLHCVDAFGPLKALLQEIPPPRGFLMHGYSGSPEYARELVPLGAHFSFNRRNLFGATGGAEITAKAGTLLRAIPFERLLLETDAPDAPNANQSESDPQLWGDLRAEDCAEGLARLHAHTANFFGIPIADFHQRLHANFIALFGGASA